MTLSDYAKTWVGKRFAGNAVEQCMLFVRHCLTEVDAPIKHTVTMVPYDGVPTSYALASSLAGKDCGLIHSGSFKPDELFFFKHTYSVPSWPQEWKDNPNLITHVAISIGDGKFVHRPTASRPVEIASLTDFWAQHFACALRWVDATPEEDSRLLKYFVHSGKSHLLIDGKPNTSLFGIGNHPEPHLILNANQKEVKAMDVKVWFE